MVVENLSESSLTRPASGLNQPTYRRTIQPLYLRGSHAMDDTVNHDYRWPSQGKARLSILVASTGDSSHNLIVYGSHNTSGTPGDIGVTEIIGTQKVGQTTGTVVSSTSAAIFPHYLARIQTDTANNGGQGQGSTVNVFIAMSAFP